MRNEFLHRLFDAARVSGMVAIAFRQRWTRIPFCLALGPIRRKRDVGAEPVAQLALGKWRLVKIPAGVCAERHGDVRQQNARGNGAFDEPGRQAYYGLASSNSTAVRTRAPAARSVGAAFSASLWLIPRSHGTKIIPVGHTRAM